MGKGEGKVGDYPMFTYIARTYLLLRETELEMGRVPMEPARLP